MFIFVSLKFRNHSGWLLWLACYRSVVCVHRYDRSFPKVRLWYVAIQREYSWCHSSISCGSPVTLSFLSTLNWKLLPLKYESTSENLIWFFSSLVPHSIEGLIDVQKNDTSHMLLVSRCLQLSYRRCLHFLKLYLLVDFCC